MWHAAQPVARKLPRTALGGVQRWQEVHSLRSRSIKTSPDSLKVGSGSRRATAPVGRGWPVGNGSPGVGEHLRMGLLRIGRRRIASVARRARERLLGVRVVDAAVTCRAILAVRCRSGRRGEAEDRQHERYDHCPGCHCQSSMRHPRYVSTSVYASLTTPLTPRASRVEETAALHCPGATVDPWIVDSRHVTSGSLM